MKTWAGVVSVGGMGHGSALFLRVIAGWKKERLPESYN